MLVRFSSQATANLLMFDDVARPLLHIIGKAPTQRGVITVAEMPAALMRLQKLVDEEKRLREAKDEKDAVVIPDVGVEPHELVHLAVRAQPFIKTLTQALREEKEVVWTAAQDFAKPKP